jgi:curved DNA-binding protein CbpA
MRDPYETLAVPRSATAPDIKKSLRRLAKKLHWDKNNPRAAALLAEIKAAYQHEILGAKRRTFDRGDTFKRDGIDPKDNPMPEGVAIVISEFTFSMAGLIVGMAIIAASPLIVRTLTPQMGINATSDGGHQVFSRIAASEERIPLSELRDLRVGSESRLPFPRLPQDSADKAPATAAPTDQNAIQNTPHSQQDHEPFELLIGRSETLLSQGDAEAARILLQPAVEAHDAGATLALGATYDPVMLAILQVRGVAADASLARYWYGKASEFGSQKAQQRLALLANALVEGKRGVVRQPIHVAASHEVVPHVAPRAAAPPSTAVSAPGIGARLARDDASRTLPALIGVSY